ncbi:hypothetical protein EV714DRAFT_255344 [Schizophyllum commune]
MISQNFTIESVCPLILYDPPSGWREGDPADDPETGKYSDGHFTLTNQMGSSASFTFNGSAIYIFGAKRDNHGVYVVELDGEGTTFSGHDQAGQFQVPLFAQDSLDNTLHTVKVTNRESLYLDIDYITWTASLEGDYSPSLTTTQDDDPMFSYTPSDAWSTAPGDIPSLDKFSGGTAHGTRSADASVSLEFTGQAVQLFGGTGSARGPYEVQLDGGDPQTFNATKRDVTPQTLLFYADGLANDKHTLTLTNKPVSDGQGLVIDYVVSYNVRGGKDSDSGSDDDTSADDSSKSGSDASGNASSSNAGAIAGGVVGTLGGLAVIAALVFFFLRRRRRKVLAEKSKLIPQSFPAPGYPPSTPDYYGSPGPYGQPTPYTDASPQPYPPQPYTGQPYPGQPPLMPNRGGFPPSEDQRTFTSYYPPTTATSYAYNTSNSDGYNSSHSQGRNGSSNGSAGQPQPPRQGGTVSPVSHDMSNPWSQSSSGRSGGGATQIGAALYAMNRTDTDSGSPTAAVPPAAPFSGPGPGAGSRKAMGVPVPPSAHEPPPTHIPMNTLQDQRIHVPGREQDFGPLPPEYSQVFQGHGNVG